MRSANIRVKNFYALSEFGMCEGRGMMPLMNAISQIRRLKGWTQGQLADVSGLNQSSVSKAERFDGGVGLRTYQAIAEALNVPLYELFLPDTSTAEMRLLEAFRSLPPDRQRGWIDMLDGLLEGQQQPGQ